MCQNIFIDFPQAKPHMIKALTLLDSMEGHEDGFGFYLPKDDVLIKSKEPCKKVWEESFDEFKKYKHPTVGNFHVRRASVKKGKTFLTKDAHPFMFSNIVFQHNGTLTDVYTKELAKYKEVWEKYDKDDPIDSLKVGAILNHLIEENDGKVDKNVINKVVNLFRGTYAFVFMHKETKKYYFATDRKKNLFVARLYLDGKLSGIMINTAKLMLEYVCRMASDMVSSRKKLTWDIRFLLDCTLYEYELGKFDLDIVGEKNSLLDVQSNYIKPKGGNSNHPKVHQEKAGGNSFLAESPKFNIPSFAKDCFELFTLVYDVGLTFSDLSAIINLTWGEDKTIANLTSEDVFEMLEVIDAMTRHYIPRKERMFNQLRSVIPVKDLYNLIEFPYVLEETTKLEELVKEHVK
jgi:predicted glutamine amidotransferase